MTLVDCPWCGAVTALFEKKFCLACKEQIYADVPSLKPETSLPAADVFRQGQAKDSIGENTVSTNSIGTIAHPARPAKKPEST